MIKIGDFNFKKISNPDEQHWLAVNLNAVVVLVVLVSELDLVSHHIGEVFFSLLTRGGSQT